MNGSIARDWGELEETTRKMQLIEQLSKMFGEEAKNYKDYFEYNWMTETFSSGCYFNVPSVGILSRYGHVLRKPFGDIHFAGSETGFYFFSFYFFIIIIFI